jgi:diguanylate cyclase (GGDEF)-like protein/PAS domain S-box-containing protein
MTQGFADTVGRRSPPATPARWRAMPYTSTAVVLCLAWLAVQLVVPRDGKLAEYLLLWGRLPLLALACWIGWRASQANRELPRAALAWALMTSAIVVLIPADLYCGWLALVLGVAVEISASDVLYLTYFPLMLCGLLVLPRGFSSRLDVERFAIDSAIVVLAGGLIVWEYSVRPAVAMAAEGFSGQMLLDLTYPLGDLSTLLAIATVLLRIPTDRARVPLLFVAAALVMSLAGDAIWMIGGLPAHQGIRNAAYALWMLQPALFVAAAELELRRARTDESGRTWRPAFAWLPYVALALCYAMLADVARDDPQRLRELFPASILLTGLVVLRQLVAHRENAALVAAKVRDDSEARFAALVERASDAILIVDRGLEIAYASPAALRLVGGASSGPIAPHLAPEDADALASFVTACARAPIARVTMTLRFGRDPVIETEASLSNLFSDPQVRGLVLNIRDVTERRALESALREHRLHDPLTGTANRALFLDRLAGALARAESGAPCALAVFDLDRFKLLNDGLGHRVGDQALTQIASRLVATIGRTDTLARLGGDEFGVLLEDALHAEHVRERVDRLRSAIAEPLRLEHHALRMTASAGLAFSAPGLTAEDLLRNADIALQHARAEGGDAVEQFRGERHGRVLERLALEAEVPALLANDAFAVAFEPCVAMADDAPVALVLRTEWREPQEQPVGTILAAIRESPAAVELARRVRQLGERDLAALVRFLPDAESLSVLLPLDPAELRQEAFVPQLREFAAHAGLPLSRIVVVVDESALATLAGRAAETLSRARQEGARLALGGFGAAHAAFELLDAYRFDMLLLAESVVARIEGGDRPATLLHAAIATGRSLGLEVLAPGVRSARQLALLRELGCDFACGPVVAAPMSYERLLPWLGARLGEHAAGAAAG